MTNGGRLARWKRRVPGDFPQEVNMFCPQCGAEIASDRVRFCTHCRFPVGSVKEFIVTEVTKSQAEDEKKHYPLRQRDISLGAALMLVGALKALFLCTPYSGDKFENAGVFVFALGLLFSAMLMFSQLSPRQRGLTVGATLVFITSLLAIPAGFATDGLGLLLVPAMFLPLIFLWTRITRWFMRTFFDKETSPDKYVSPYRQPAPYPGAASAPALLSAQNEPAVEPTTNRMKEAETVMPFSVTENTTAMLKNKPSINRS
jgi:hypothetical protein